MVQDFLDGLYEKGSAPATVRQYLAISRQAYNLAGQTVVDGWPMFTGLHPAAGIKLPEIKNARSRFLTGLEVEALLAGAPKIDQDLHDAVAQALNAGLRLGELERLTWPDIDFHSGFLSVRDETDRKAGDTVPMNDTVRRLLLARKPPGVKGGPVFAKSHGGNFRDYISKSFRRLADELDLNNDLSLDNRQRQMVFYTLRTPSPTGWPWAGWIFTASKL